MFKLFKHELLVWKRSIYELILNDIIPIILCRHLRCFMYSRLFKAKIGKDVYMYRSLELRSPQNLVIVGKNSIGKHVMLDARKGLRIEEGCVIASHVLIWTLHHDYNSDDFHVIGAPVTLGAYSWICSRSIILPGVTIGEGAVIASGAVVTKDVRDNTVVAGVPATVVRKIEKGEWKRVLFVPTGALMSTVSFNEGASVPGIAHGIVLEHWPQAQ